MKTTSYVRVGDGTGVLRTDLFGLFRFRHFGQLVVVVHRVPVIRRHDLESIGAAPSGEFFSPGRGIPLFSPPDLFPGGSFLSGRETLFGRRLFVRRALFDPNFPFNLYLGVV